MVRYYAAINEFAGPFWSLFTKKTNEILSFKSRRNLADVMERDEERRLRRKYTAHGLGL